MNVRYDYVLGFLYFYFDIMMFVRIQTSEEGGVSHVIAELSYHFQYNNYINYIRFRYHLHSSNDETIMNHK